MQEFAGKVAVVTGGAGGIGRALVERFTDEGMKAVVADIVPEAVEQTTAELRDQGREVIGVVTDVTSLESVEALRDATLEAFGGVHIVCNNAGIGSGSEGNLWQHHVNDWRWSLDVNVMGVVNGINAFVPTMIAQRRGRSRRQHDVGQRRVHAADQQRRVRDDEGGGDDDHRVPLGSVARGRVAGRRLAAVPVDAARPGCSTPGSGGRGRTGPSATTGPGAPPKEGRDSLAQYQARMEAAGHGGRFAPLSEVADICFEGIRDGAFWIAAPSEEQQAKIRARATSQIEMTEPTYLLAPQMMAPKPAGTTAT